MTASAQPTERRHADPITIVRVHQAGLWRYLRYLGCDAAEAEDLTQETFLAVLRRPFIDRGPATTARYLQTVARNLFLKSLRSQSGLPVVGMEFADQSVAAWSRLCERDGGARYLDALRECLDVLDGRGRSVVSLRYEQGCSRSEIAERLGMGLDGVKSLLRRVRQLLRTCVERRIA